MTDFDNLATELNEGGSTSSSTSSDTSQYRDAPIINVCPQVALGFDEIVDVGIMGGIKEEQNIRVNNGFGNNAVVTLRNPHVLDGDLYKSTGDTSADYKLVDPDSANVEEAVTRVDGEFEVTGVSVYSRDFPSEEVDDFDEDHVRLMIGSAAGKRLLQVLDCKGGVSAYFDSEGNRSDGLIEYPPEYGDSDYDPKEHGYERIARGPTLRNDMVGEGGVLFFYLSDRTYNGGNHMHKVSIFHGDPSPSNELGVIEDGGEPEYPPWLVWDEPSENVDETSDDTGDDASGDLDFDALDENEDATDTINDYGDLTDAQQQFFDKVRDEGMDPDKHDIARTYQKFAEANGLDTLEPEVVNTIASKEVA